MGTATMTRSAEGAKAGSGNNGSKLVEVYGSVPFDCDSKKIRLGKTEEEANNSRRKKNQDFVLLRCWGVLSNGESGCNDSAVVRYYSREQKSDGPRIQTVNQSIESKHQNFTVTSDHWTAFFNAIRQSNAGFIPAALKARL